MSDGGAPDPGGGATGEIEPGPAQWFDDMLDDDLRIIASDFESREAFLAGTTAAQRMFPAFGGENGR
jgi:hypothetical protein